MEIAHRIYQRKDLQNVSSRLPTSQEWAVKQQH